MNLLCGNASLAVTGHLFLVDGRADLWNLSEVLRRPSHAKVPGGKGGIKIINNLNTLKADDKLKNEVNK